MQPNEIHALIQLLDDPDEGVYKHVREQLLWDLSDAREELSVRGFLHGRRVRAENRRAARRGRPQLTP